jgi:hypothetical protein
MSCLRYCGFVRLHDHAEQVDFFRLNSFSHCPPRRSRVTLERERPDVADDQLAAKGRKVGHDAGVCTFTSVAPPEAACQITFFLSSGEIAIYFLNAPPPRSSPSAASAPVAGRAEKR